MSPGKDLRSRCHTPPAASQDRCRVRVGESALIRRHSCGPTQACRLCSSSKKPPRFRPATACLRDSSPGQAETSWDLGAGRAGLSSAENPTRCWGRDEETRSASSCGPSAGPWSGQASLWGLPHSPSCQGLQVLSSGLTSDSSPSPFSQPPAPVCLRGAFRAAP